MRPLARLLGLLLLLGWGSATAPHARALAALAGASAVEICGDHGPRTLLLGADGQPLQPADPADCCVLCLGPATAPPPVLADISPPRPRFAPAPMPPRPAVPPPRPPLASSQLPRAPPQA